LTCAPIEEPHPLNGDEADWNWRFIGFGSGTDKVAAGNSSHAHFFWTIRYWSIVIPLTIISLWLLLSQPRSSNQMKISETTSAPEKVV
jgi:hypothetical protein